MASQRIKVIQALLLLAGVLAVAHAPILLGGTRAESDALTYMLQARLHLAAELGAGRLPEWWNAVGLGVPFAASPNNGVTYPLAWMLAMLPMPSGADLFLLGHLWLAGAGTCLLARRWGADAAGGTLAGAAFMLCGYAGAVVPNGIAVLTLGWTPLVAWSADRLAERLGAERDRGRAIPALLLHSALVALQVMSGDPAGMVTSALLSFGLVLARAPRRAPALAGLVAANAAAVALAAVTVGPALGLLAGSQRASGIAADAASVWSLHPLRALELLWPRALGDFHDPSRNLARIVADTAPAGQLASSWSASLHVGAPVLALLCWALLRGRTDASEPSLRPRLALAGGFVILALGRFTPAYAAYRAAFPPEQFLRYPEKHVVGALVIASAVAGVALTRALATDGRALARVSALVLAVQAAGLGAVLLLEDRIARGLDPSSRVLQLEVDATAALEVALKAGLPALVAASLFLAAVVARRRLGRLAPALAVAAVAGGLAAHQLAMGRVIPRSEAMRTPQLLQGLGAAGRSGGELRERLFRPMFTYPPRPGAPASEAARLVLDTVSDNVAAAHGLGAVPGYDPTFDALWLRLWQRDALTLPVQRLTSCYDVRFVAMPVMGRDLAPALPLRRRGPLDMLLLENTSRRPRAFVAPRSLREPAEATLRTLVERDAPPPDPGLVRIVAPEASPTAGTPGVPAPCLVAESVPELVELDCSSATGGHAVLLDAWAPGWTATVDGAPAEILRADLVARAVAVSPGRHRIVMRYETPGLRPGAIISACSWLLLGIVAVVAGHRPFA